MFIAADRTVSGDNATLQPKSHVIAARSGKSCPMGA